jgi:hypothetical protein
LHVGLLGRVETRGSVPGLRRVASLFSIFVAAAVISPSLRCSCFHYSAIRFAVSPSSLPRLARALICSLLFLQISLMSSWWRMIPMWSATVCGRPRSAVKELPRFAADRIPPPSPTPAGTTPRRSHLLICYTWLPIGSPSTMLGKRSAATFVPREMAGERGSGRKREGLRLESKLSRLQFAMWGSQSPRLLLFPSPSQAAVALLNSLWLHTQQGSTVRCCPDACILLDSSSTIEPPALSCILFGHVSGLV